MTDMRKCSICEAKDFFLTIRDIHGNPWEVEQAIELFETDLAKYNNLFPMETTEQAVQTQLVPRPEGLVCTYCLMNGKEKK